MGLLDILYETADEVTGTKMIGIIGTDGLPVELVMDDEYVPHNHETAEMELAWFLSAASRTAERLDVGNVYDLTLETDDIVYLFSLVARNYYAVLAVAPDSDLDSARVMVHRCVERCLTEL